MNLYARRVVLFCLLVGMLTLSLVPTLAQSAEVITMGENKLAEVTDENPTVMFQYEAANAEMVFLQALAVSDGFAPQVMISHNNVLVETLTNPAGEAVAEGNVELANAGMYVFEVQSANGTTGQFVLSLQEGQEDLPEPLPLMVNVPERADVTEEMSLVRYSFSASPTDDLVLEVEKDTTLDGANVVVEDAQTGELLAKFGANLDGDLMVPAGTTSYLVNVSYRGDGATEDATLLLRAAADVADGEGEEVVDGAPEPVGEEEPPAPPPAPPVVVDTDGDGVADDVDACPELFGNGPDGCPEEVPPVEPPDTDGDGFTDDNDVCPNEPGIAPNGCPDSDGDGVADDVDACPDGFGNNEDGCVDTDGDGISDPFDGCPIEPGPAENGGCPVPVPDNDGDGIPDDEDLDDDNDWIPDGEDECPLEPAPLGTGGCPVPGDNDFDGVPDDTDNDGKPDIIDACPLIFSLNPSGCP